MSTVSVARRQSFSTNEHAQGFGGGDDWDYYVHENVTKKVDPKSEFSNFVIDLLSGHLSGL